MAPIDIDNLQPFHALFAVPSRIDGTIISPGTKHYGLGFNLVSNFTDAVRQDEAIVIDGETYRIDLTARYGFKNNWELGFKLPIISHRGGFLDNFLIRWHNWFGLPSLGRDTVANNQLNYSYRDASGTRISITDSTSGLGDITLFAGHQLPVANPALRRAVFTSLKLPTGSARKLTGSGGVDLSAWLTQSFRPSNKIRLDLRAGVSLLGPGDVLPEKQRDGLVFAGGALSYRVSPRVSLKTSVQVNSSPYQDTRIDQLGGGVAQLTLGGSIRIHEHWVLDLAVTEDELNPDVSPDVSFKFVLRQTNDL